MDWDWAVVAEISPLLPKLLQLTVFISITGSTVRQTDGHPTHTTSVTSGSPVLERKRQAGTLRNPGTSSKPKPEHCGPTQADGAPVLKPVN